MKIFSWNVNGIRSVFRTTFRDWLKEADPDIVCLQEIKADHGDLPDELKNIAGYHAYFNSATKKGYSGTAVYTKVKPLSIETKLGLKRFDDEGRVMRLDFKDFTLFNFYFPHGGRMKENFPYKFKAYKSLFKKLNSITDKKVILAGDFNIAHTELDLYYPKQNRKNTMFTPEERAQIDSLISLGYTDAFRHKNPEKRAYTWWPYRNGLRAKDIGWRIDYIFVNEALKHKIKDAQTFREVGGSDHGPLGVIFER